MGGGWVKKIMREEKGHQISKGLANRGMQGKGGARVKRGHDLRMKQRVVLVGIGFFRFRFIDNKNPVPRKEGNRLPMD